MTLSLKLKLMTAILTIVPNAFAGEGPDWPSGAACRGTPWSACAALQSTRTLDVCMYGGDGGSTWSSLLDQVTASHSFRRPECDGYIFSLDWIPLGTQDNVYGRGCKAVYSEIAAGKRDSIYLAAIAGLKRKMNDDGFRDYEKFAIRIGKELNETDGPYALTKCTSLDDAAVFKAAFKRVATLIRDHLDPRVHLVINFTKNSPSLSQPIKNFIPVDDGKHYIDSIGVDYYDRGLNDNTSDASVDKAFHAYGKGGNKDYPVGIYTWLALAKSFNKKLTFEEWGLAAKGITGAGGDNPYFIKGMYKFFCENQTGFTYESYFHGNERNQFNTLAGKRLFPKAAAMYTNLFSKPCP